MSNLLDTAYSKFINAPAKNPTQTMMRRFQRVPWGEMESEFTKVRREWDELLKKGLDTHYSKIWMSK